MKETSISANDPALYEKFVAMNPMFEKINQEVMRVIGEHQRRMKKRQLTILDLGAGTGLQARMLAQKFPEAKIIVVEQDETFFTYLNKNVQLFPNILPFQDDIVSFKSNQKTDIIMLRFVYHHIPDNHKINFLENIRSNLKQDGILIVVEECLGKYSNEVERRKRDEIYHRHRIELAERAGDPGYIAYQKRIFALNLCPNKTSLAILNRQLAAAKFHHLQTISLKNNNSSVAYDNILGHYLILANK